MDISSPALIKGALGGRDKNVVVVNKREVTYFMLKEGNALTPAAWDPRRGSCSHTLVTARCMLCCTSMRNVFCIHAETGDGQGEVY